MDDLWSKLQEFTIISTWKLSKSSSTNHCSFHDFISTVKTGILIHNLWLLQANALSLTISLGYSICNWTVL